MTFNPPLLGVPSAPRNLVSVVNQTWVLLEWHSPRDTGHRDDLSYNVLCRRCHSAERRACQPCDDSVKFVPGKRGLKETRVEISKLRAHTSYTFIVQVCPLKRSFPIDLKHWTQTLLLLLLSWLKFDYLIIRTSISNLYFCDMTSTVPPHRVSYYSYEASLAAFITFTWGLLMKGRVLMNSLSWMMLFPNILMRNPITVQLFTPSFTY